jgi:rRNA-processing protein FCF1
MINSCRTDGFEALGKLLSAPIKLFTSRCVLAELRQLGPDFAGAHVLLSEH